MEICSEAAGERAMRGTGLVKWGRGAASRSFLEGEQCQQPWVQPTEQGPVPIGSYPTPQRVEPTTHSDHPSTLDSDGESTVARHGTPSRFGKGKRGRDVSGGPHPWLFTFIRSGDACPAYSAGAPRIPLVA